MIVTLGAAAGLVIIPFNPENRLLLRLAYLTCLAGVWCGSLILAWKRRLLRSMLLMAPVLAGVLFFLPAKPVDGEDLRTDFVRRLAGYEGVKYFWGGESARGIDCSGLPRKAFRDALFAYGFRHFNSRALRAGVAQWWFDASAEALSHGYRSATVPIGISGTLRDLDFRALKPGDLAVTAGGVHVLVYLGDHRWIQADPMGAKVVVEDARTTENGWFGSAVTLHRWSMLAGSSLNAEEVRTQRESSP